MTSLLIQLFLFHVMSFVLVHDCIFEAHVSSSGSECAGSDDSISFGSGSDSGSDGEWELPSHSGTQGHAEMAERAYFGADPSLTEVSVPTSASPLHSPHQSPLHSPRLLSSPMHSPRAVPAA